MHAQNAQTVFDAEQKLKKYGIDANSTSRTESARIAAAATAQDETLKTKSKSDLKALDRNIGEFTRAPDVKPLIEARTDIANISTIADSELAKTSVGFQLDEERAWHVSQKAAAKSPIKTSKSFRVTQMLSLE
jgi:hypothetical protein